MSEVEHIEQIEEAEFNDGVRVSTNQQEEEEFATDGEFSECEESVEKISPTNDDDSDEVTLKLPSGNIETESDDEEEIRQWKNNPAFQR